MPPFGFTDVAAKPAATGRGAQLVTCDLGPIIVDQDRLRRTAVHPLKRLSNDI